MFLFPPETENRGYVYDNTFVLLILHDSNCFLGEKERGMNIDIEKLEPFLFRHFRRISPSYSPGIIH